jgi:hypothetical protein
MIVLIFYKNISPFFRIIPIFFRIVPTFGAIAPPFWTIAPPFWTIVPISRTIDASLTETHPVISLNDWARKTIALYK